MKIILLLFLLFCTAPLFAADGNRLIEMCSVADKPEFTPEEFSRLGACTNYIEGVLDAHVMWESMMRRDHNKKHAVDSLCLPERTTITGLQSARIVLKYLRDNPDKLHWVAAPLVVNALHGAFSCSHGS